MINTCTSYAHTGNDVYILFINIKEAISMETTGKNDIILQIELNFKELQYMYVQYM